MKKLKSLLVAVVVLGCLTGLARAGSYDSQSIRYRFAVAAAISTHCIVVDLSDTTNWYHRQAGEIQIKSLRLYVDKLAASTCTVKVGIVNFVNQSTGSVTYFTGINAERNVSNTANSVQLEYESTNRLNLKAIKNATVDTSGSTPYIISNDTLAGSTAFQTDVNLPSVVGNGKPGLGDLVLSVSNGTAAVEVYCEVTYQGAD